MSDHSHLKFSPIKYLFGVTTGAAALLLAYLRMFT